MLVDSNISQLVFAKEVLNTAWKTLNKLLYMPRPWNECSIINKRLYHKMQVWSRSPESIESLKGLKAKRDVTIKRIDVFKLVNKIKDRLFQLGMPRTEFATIVDIESARLQALIMCPERWDLLSKVKKDCYYRMKVWLAEQSEDSDDDANVNEEIVIDDSTSEEEERCR
jgi:hypothetical protein